MSILSYIAQGGYAGDGVFGTVMSIVMPVLTSIAGYLAGRKKRNNNFLADLQKSIDLLAEKNKDLMSEVVKLRSENADLLSRIEELSRQNEVLRKEIEDLNTKLENVKTITRSK